MSETSERGIDLLIVDDNATFGQVLARAFSRRGLRVAIAQDLATACAIAQEQRPARAVVDLKLGADSGLQVIGALLDIDPDIAIVMLTGYSSIATAVEAVKLGAVNYLCKPAGGDEILAAFGASAPNPDLALPEQPPSVDRVEWEHIQRVLKEHDGNISATARALGMHRRTLQRKLQKRPVRQ
jgi:two-component system response regulator RegA